MKEFDDCRVIWTDPAWSALMKMGNVSVADYSLVKGRPLPNPANSRFSSNVDEAVRRDRLSRALQRYHENRRKSEVK